jgi:HAD superfamily phosphatase (TIGR01668 family)
LLGRCSERLGPLARKLDIPFVAKALKPFPFGCHAALKQLGLPAHRAGLIGDQLFADVLAGRLAGLFTILVTPVGHHEPSFTRLKRPFERGLLHWQKRRDLDWYMAGKEATVQDRECQSHLISNPLESIRASDYSRPI